MKRWIVLSLTLLAALGSGLARADDKPVESQVVDAMIQLFGQHPGYRPAHAKGVLFQGNFVPAPAAGRLITASHFQRGPVPVIVRFSDSTGIPSLPDGDPLAVPHGMAIKFHLEDGSDTDIVAHSFNGFPVATAEDLRDLLLAAAAAAGPAKDASKLAEFLAGHPAAAKAIQAPKPAPVSFVTESYYGVNAFRFTDRNGKSRYARYQIRPMGKEEFLDGTDAALKDPDYLSTELTERVAKGRVQMRLVAQLASTGDPTNDATKVWSDDNAIVDLGAIQITNPLPNGAEIEKQILFTPGALTDGIEPSDDPLINARTAAYADSFSRRTQ